MGTYFCETRNMNLFLQKSQIKYLAKNNTKQAQAQIQFRSE